jgi:O-antigen/teichoic acid export membrane protein
MLLSTLVFFGAGFLAKIFNEPYLESIFRAFSVSVPFFAVMSIALWATQGFRTVKYDAYVRQLLQPLVNLVLIVVFYLFGIQILGAVFAYILSMAASSALALYYLNRVFPKLLDRSTLPKPETQAFFSVSWPMVVAKLAQYMDFWAPVAVLGIFFTAEAVGIYNTAARTAVLCSIVLMAFTGIFSPMIANLHARGLSDELGNLYKDVCRWVFVGSLAVVFFTVLLSKDIMAIFGEEFVTGWMALAIVAGAWLFDNSAGPADRILVMTGHQKLVMLIMVSYAVAGIAGSVALVPLYSIVGAAVATAAAKMSLNVGMLFFVWRRLGFWPYDYRTLKPVVAGLLAATTTLAIRQLLRLPEGFIAVLVLFIPFLASYVAILLVLGLSPSDRQLLNACWKTIKHYTPRMP